MARRRRPEKRQIQPDPIYNSVTAAKFINSLMKDGKKSVAERIFYSALEFVREQTKVPDPLDVLMKALSNVKPLLEVKSRRVGGATYQVPIEVPPHRQTALAMRWIISFAGSRKGRRMEDCLGAEIVDAYNNTGPSVKKREDTHKMAAANKAFAHYRW
ncbi:MAG: 30S ribosomal protein S7 [Candidatus Tritonobacter lacicola]|nr:30S ribosomal protein S7 [Candidatus Tritonobacter lacicola]